jgi:hypothetical protein
LPRNAYYLGSPHDELIAENTASLHVLVEVCVAKTEANDADVIRASGSRATTTSTR